MTLIDLKTGQKGIIHEFTVSKLHQRLLAMGVSPGDEVEVIRKLPFVGSMYVKMGMRRLALRHSEGAGIVVTPLLPNGHSVL